MFSTKITFINSTDSSYDRAEFFTDCLWCSDPEEATKRRKEWLERLEEVLYIMQELTPYDSRNWARNLWDKEPVEFTYHNITKHLVSLTKGPFDFQVVVRDI